MGLCSWLIFRVFCIDWLELALYVDSEQRSQSQYIWSIISCWTLNVRIMICHILVYVIMPFSYFLLYECNLVNVNRLRLENGVFWNAYYWKITNIVVLNKQNAAVIAWVLTIAIDMTFVSHHKRDPSKSWQVINQLGPDLGLRRMKFMLM